MVDAFIHLAVSILINQDGLGSDFHGISIKKMPEDMAVRPRKTISGKGTGQGGIAVHFFIRPKHNVCFRQEERPLSVNKNITLPASGQQETALRARK